MDNFYNSLQFCAFEGDKAGSSALDHRQGLCHTNEYPFKEDVVMLFSFLSNPVTVFKICQTEVFCFIRCKRVISTAFIQIFLWLLFSGLCEGHGWKRRTGEALVVEECSRKK